MPTLDVRAHNREAWNRNVAEGNQYTVPASPQRIAAARQGQWEIGLTDGKRVPAEWFPPMKGLRVLGLASGGGQQMPVLAAAGAQVTVFDNSPAQLAQDAMVAEREGLSMRLEEGDMRDLSRFRDGSFDLIFHPISNVFCPEILPVWRECYRVLTPGGVLLAGFMNPDVYVFDLDLLDNHNRLKVRNRLPYNDLEHLSPAKKKIYLQDQLAFEYSHSMDTQVGGQLAVGFVLTGFYEDRYAPERQDRISEYIPAFFATRALKPFPAEVGHGR